MIRDCIKKLGANGVFVPLNLSILIGYFFGTAIFVASMALCVELIKAGVMSTALTSFCRTMFSGTTLFVFDTMIFAGSFVRLMIDFNKDKILW